MWLLTGSERSLWSHQEKIKELESILKGISEANPIDSLEQEAAKKAVEEKLQLSTSSNAYHLRRIEEEQREKTLLLQR